MGVFILDMDHRDLGRLGAVTVWTGAEILVWGGTSDTQAVGVQYGAPRGGLLADGAIFRMERS